MKKIMIISVLTCSSFAFAADNAALVKECSVTMTQLDSGKKVNTNIKITTQDNQSLNALVVESIEEKMNSYTDVVQFSEQTVRPNLSVKSDDSSLNDAEKIILHAMSLQGNPIFKGAYTTGIDLKKVRSAKMYRIGQATKLGSATVVEAKDKNGKVLGSFLGGFLISPCK